MAWKKDEGGNFVVDTAGNPIWIDGTDEKSVDYVAMSNKLKEASAESRTRKEKLRELEEKYAVIKDIDDLTAWHKEATEAMEKIKAMPDKDKEIEAQISERIATATGTLKAQLAEKDKFLSEKNQLITEQTNRLNNLLVKTAVQSSKLLNENINPKFRALVRRELERAGRVDKEGKVVFVDDDNAIILAGEDAHNATTDEAIREIIRKLGMDDQDFIMSGNNQQGSNGLPNPGSGGNLGNKKYSDMTTEEKIAYLKNQNNLKSQR